MQNLSIEKNIMFDLLKKAFAGNIIGKTVTKDKFLIFVNNILQNMSMLNRCYAELKEEQKNEIVTLAKLNDNSLSKYLFHLKMSNLDTINFDNLDINSFDEEQKKI